MNLQPIPFGIQSYKDEHPQVSSQNLINLYPEQAPSKMPMVLKQTPGLSLYATVGSAHRGAWVMNSKRYVVSGTTLYKEFPLGTFTSVGTIPGTGRVGMASNGRDLGRQLMIVNGTTTGYSYSEEDGLESVTLTGPAYTVVYQDGYFIFDWAGTNYWFISSINDGTQFDSTETGATNARPDNVLAVISKQQQIWVPGEESFEVFVNTPRLDFPFEKIAEVTVDDIGLANRDSLVYVDNTLMFVGSDRNVYQTEGYLLRPIGDTTIAKALEDADLTQITAFGFTWLTHAFYQLNLANGVSYRFDAKTRLWHQVRGWNAGYARHRAGSCHTFNNRVYAGDYANGNIYELSSGALTDNGTLIRREMVTPILHQNGNQFSVNRLRADMVMGVGNANAPTPVVMLAYSNNGDDWSDPIPGFLGAVGDRGTQIWWNSLGCHYEVAFKIWWTDSVNTALRGLYWNVG